MLYGCYAAYATAAINLWWMAGLTSVLVTRGMIALRTLSGHLAALFDLITRHEQ